VSRELVRVEEFLSTTPLVVYFPNALVRLRPRRVLRGYKTLRVSESYTRYLILGRWSTLTYVYCTCYVIRLCQCQYCTLGRHRADTVSRSRGSAGCFARKHADLSSCRRHSRDEINRMLNIFITGAVLLANRLFRGFRHSLGGCQNRWLQSLQ